MSARHESSFSFYVLREHILSGKPGDKNRCAVWHALDAMGLTDISVGVVRLAGGQREVRAEWKALDANTGRTRKYRALIDPPIRALDILTSNDVGKESLIRECPARGYRLTTTETTSTLVPKPREAREQASTVRSDSTSHPRRPYKARVKLERYVTG